MALNVGSRLGRSNSTTPSGEGGGTTSGTALRNRLRGALPLAVAVLCVIGPWPRFGLAHQGQDSDDITWVRDVGPLMAEGCMNCHRPGQVAPMSLLTYEDVRPWAASIRMMVEARIMPVGDESVLGDEQVETLLAWIAAGAPRGEGEFVAPEFTQSPAAFLLPGGLGHYDHELALRARAIRVNSPISIDGVLGERAWAEAFPISNFRQTLPLEGELASEQTEVFVAYDDDAIYVGAVLGDRSPVTTRLARRDSELGDSDVLRVLLDSYHDHETAYRFWTNPSGARGDAIVTGNSSGGGDASWDPVWDVATQVTETGWVVEMRIPFSQLRFGPDEHQEWGIQVERNINRNQENATFPFTPTLERSGVSRFAHLDGIEGIKPGRRLELLPYVVARGDYLQQAPSGVDFPNPYRSGSDHFGSMGLDLKYRIASNVTLDATVNPDFGQVELDPSVINLTAFETRFAEQRPFFVEGADIFTLGEGGPRGSVGNGPQLVYSRRIGRKPRGSVPSAAPYSDIPATTTIAGAAKVTGRVGDGWTLGILEAVTASETAAYTDVDRAAHKLMVEPATNYFTGRLRRQVRGGRTRLGILASAVNRDVSGTPLADRLHASAYSGGIDVAHETGNRTWLFSGLISGSRVGGDPAAIARTQRSSARYYQRPDATHVEIDPVATSLSGFYAMGHVEKQAGNLTMRTSLAAVSPGYEVNDLGFQTYADRVLLDTQVRYTRPSPGRILRSWNVTLGGPDATWNFAGNRTLANVNGLVSLEFLNYWRTLFYARYDPWTDDDRLTRGGPIARSPSSHMTFLRVTSDQRRAAVGSVDFTRGADVAGGWNRRVRVNLSARLRQALQVSVAPAYSWSYSSAQYVSRVTDPLAQTTHGARYLFAGLDRTTLSLQSRVNVTFTPTLSLEVYLEPFVSVGDYGDLKEFSEPGTFDFSVYGQDVGTASRSEEGGYDIDPDGGGPADGFSIANRDFTYRSLLGNTVLRWEWRPGSTMFFVWQQSRIDSTSGGGRPWVGSFDLGRDLGGVFTVAPDNVFMIKVNYWLNP